MQFEYTRTASHSYMIVKDADYQHAGYVMQMLVNNRIPGLLELKKLSENGVSEYWFDITGLQPFECRNVNGKVGWENLCMVIRNICDVKMSLEKYLLDADDLIYDGKHIFQDRKTEKLKFCYVPGFSEVQKNGLLVLMEGLLEHLDHNDPKTVKAGYELYEACAAGEAGVGKLMACISRPEQKLSFRPHPPVSFRPVPEHAAGDVLQVSEGRADLPGEELQRSKKHFPARKRRKKEVFDDWTEDDFAELKEIGRWDKKPGPDPGPIRQDPPTELFSQTVMQGGLMLLYKGDGKERDLRPQKYPYVIGKKEGSADGILHARTVSRIHARIYEEGGGYYLEDANSTNGTYVNGELLPCNTPYPLRQGDSILFGDELYQAALIP